MSEITITATAAKGGRHLVVATNGVGQLHRDAIDLNSAAGRTRFVGATMRAAFGDAGDDWPKGVREELDKKLLAMSAVPPGGETTSSEDAPTDPRAKALADTPQDIRADADALLDDPKVLERVVADVEAGGVVGEKRLAATLYLLGVSAQLPRPLSAIVNGSSASGKSYVVSQVAGWFPPEVVLYATSLTTNALYYFEPGTLRHRLIVAGERSRLEDDDRAEATRALREMIEAGRLTKAVPVKENDRIVTKVIEQEGPIAFVETTTLNSIFDEDANRCLLLGTDERQEQTRRILDATAASAAGRTRPDLERVKAVHHAAMRMVPRADVVIPFAEHVAALYPTKQLDARRHFRHLLSLVKACALLHFRQRERDEHGNVIATIADYGNGERLARSPLGAASSGVSDGARAYLAALREAFKDREFTTTEAQKVGEGSKRSRYGRLNELNAAGAVEQTEAGKGKVPAKWKLTDVRLEDGAGVLPSVQNITERLSGCTHAHKP